MIDFYFGPRRLQLPGSACACVWLACLINRRVMFPINNVSSPFGNLQRDFRFGGFRYKILTVVASRRSSLFPALS